ncbi:MAG: hypothetical protein H7321_05665 [Bacteroidia bacterium]|nr:hypothetical protein [Bacteroidia bacterium]
MNNKIEYIKHNAIDTGKWNTCIDNSYNGMVYGYSWFIEGMAGKKWDALILNDYEAVFPLVWNKKYGLSYLYQPYFIQQLGIFSLLPLTTQQIWNFFDTIPRKFSFREISLNASSRVFMPDTELSDRTTYILDLNKPYHELYDNYNADAKKNLAKSAIKQLDSINDVPVEKVVEYYKNAYGALNPSVKPEVYEKIEALGKLAVLNGKAISLGVTGAGGELLAAGLFLISHSRAHYVLGAPSEEGKAYGATHTLIDAFIKQYAGTEMILDFEGSDIPTVAYFYSKFGSSPTTYYHLKQNLLPWWAKLLKK